MMTSKQAIELSHGLFDRAIPFLRVTGLDREKTKWFRHSKDPDDDRIGPWHHAKVDFLDETVRMRTKACLYLVKAYDGGIRYVGEGDTLSVRWRRPREAFEHGTGRKILDKPIFHNRCWQMLEAEAASKPSFPYEVRVLPAAKLRSEIESSARAHFGSELAVADEREFVDVVEDHLRRFRCRVRPDTGNLFLWNRK